MFSDIIPKNTARAALNKVLTEAKRLFDNAAQSRPDARNVLVVIIDKKSGSTQEDLKRAAKDLELSDVSVIGVALGDEANKEELDILSPGKDDVIQANDTDGPKKIADDIMEKALRGKIKYIWRGMYVKNKFPSSIVKSKEVQGRD